MASFRVARAIVLESRLPYVGGLTLAVALAAGCGKSGEENKGSAAAPTPVAAKATRADAAPVPDPNLPRHWVEPTAAAALARMLEQVKPRVLGIGEVHLVAGGPKVRSALSRFTDDMLAGLDGRATDIVVETWVSEGACGKTEKQVTADVRATTERPPETESEITRLLRRSRELHMRPHVMTMRCKQYESVRSKTGEVDYDKLLTLIGSELHRNVRAALDAGGKDATVLVYGGSLHNDRQPNEGVAAYSYGAKLVEELGDGYVELDLYVPELVESDELLKTEPWFPLLAQASGKVVLVERSPRSYILLLPRTAPR